MNHKILVTGFKKFDVYALNSSELVLTNLDRKIGSFEVEKLLLPVEFEESVRLVKVKLSEDKNIKFVLMLGQAAGRKKICLERVALNWIESQLKDESGKKLGPCKICETGPEAIFSSLDLPNILNVLQKKNFEFEISLNAGGYVCNHLYYEIQKHLLSSGIPGIFVHLPLLASVENNRFETNNNQNENKLIEESSDLIKSLPTKNDITTSFNELLLAVHNLIRELTNRVQI